MSDQQIEQEIQAKGKTAARVTPEALDKNIVAQYFFTGEQAVSNSVSNHQALSLLTFCVLVLENGFTVTGEAAYASAENFDAEIGRKIAKQNAVAKIWPLMGYELKQRLYEAQPSTGYGAV